MKEIILFLLASLDNARGERQTTKIQEEACLVAEEELKAMLLRDTRSEKDLEDLNEIMVRFTKTIQEEQECSETVKK